MSQISKQLEPFLLIRSEALDVIAQTEGWRTLSASHERELCEVVELEPDVISEMAAQIRRMSMTGKVELCDPAISGHDKDDPSLDDDVAMIVRFGVPFADRNPFVSFWSLAVLLSLHDDRYHEAKNYWLSAAASIVDIARKRSVFVRCAYITALVSALRRPIDELHDVVLLPTLEIVLELSEEAHRLGATPVSEEPMVALSSLLKSSLPLAVENNALQIARGAFPLLHSAHR